MTKNNDIVPKDAITTSTENTGKTIDMSNVQPKKGDRTAISMNTILDKDGNVIGYFPEYGTIE